MPAAVVPPRTSSSRRTQQQSDRSAHPDSSRDANGRIDPSDHSSRSRRANQPAQQQQQQQQQQQYQQYQQQHQQDYHGANGARDARDAHHGVPPTAAQSRSPPQNTHSPNGPSREASEILNSILISQPEVDVEREKERLAIAQPHQTQTPNLQDDDAAPPPAVSMSDPADESRRGGRSRHDHSRREKQTKFGEYILGNTIGEGEFGKVKLGWKQEGGVQVRVEL